MPVPVPVPVPADAFASVAAPAGAGRAVSASELVWLRNQFYSRAVGSLLPIRWFGPEAPRPEALSVPEGRLRLQIVSHCWRYAHLLRFQLSSLAEHPPRDVDVTYSLYHAEEDTGVRELIERFGARRVPNVTWEWNVLPREELFRRAIGRHRAALGSAADWLWFSDCDLIFHAGCLDSLAASLRGRRSGLVFPREEHVSALLAADHPMLNRTPAADGTVGIDTSLFRPNPIERAKGAFQIVHGDVARAAGYCGTIELYQRPSATWRKTYEDTVFRRLIGYEGEPVDVAALYRIRHVEKGRYAESSLWSRARRGIRRVQG